jgi:hypothetical protein
MINTILDPATRNELIQRIQLLQENSRGQWGRMSVYEMAKHCSNWDAWILGKDKDHVYTQTLLGKIFGRLALRSTVKDNTPMKKGMPAGKLAVKKLSGDLEAQKKIWIQQVKEFEHYSNTRFVHDFFGVMTEEQIGILAYKHADHHLRQFGV